MGTPRPTLLLRDRPGSIGGRYGVVVATRPESYVVRPPAIGPAGPTRAGLTDTGNNSPPENVRAGGRRSVMQSTLPTRTRMMDADGVEAPWWLTFGYTVVSFPSRYRTTHKNRCENEVRVTPLKSAKKPLYVCFSFGGTHTHVRLPAQCPFPSLATKESHFAPDKNSGQVIAPNTGSSYLNLGRRPNVLPTSLRPITDTNNIRAARREGFVRGVAR
jgi:hypothetical protein